MPRESVNPAEVWDPRSYGYSQVVKVTSPQTLIFVAGQAAVSNDMTLAAADIEGQTRSVFENIRLCLDAAGATLADIVTMTVYLHDIDDHKHRVRAVRSDFFEAGHEPVSTMVQVSKFAADGMLIEVSATAALSLDPGLGPKQRIHWRPRLHDHRRASPSRRLQGLRCRTHRRRRVGDDGRERRGDLRDPTLPRSSGRPRGARPSRRSGRAPRCAVQRNRQPQPTL